MEFTQWWSRISQSSEMLRRVDGEIFTNVTRDSFASIFRVTHSNKKKDQIGLIDREVKALSSMETFSFIH